MGERRKWRPDRRNPAAEEKKVFRNLNIGVLGFLVLFWETRTTGSRA
jgi:hypothetical protein